MKRWLGALLLTFPFLVALAPSRAGSTHTVADDAATVAALDTEYQAAVKRNDAQTMDRILADDFVLVTGRGQVFTKTDLLREARNQSTIYEHQEDTEQNVRVWGDTAVVTALLWLKGSSGSSQQQVMGPHQASNDDLWAVPTERPASVSNGSAASAGAAFERKLWFSDTYVRTPTGWRYVFGQASLALP
jgi:ketosteroid isomerase-like protein